MKSISHFTLPQLSKPRSSRSILRLTAGAVLSVTAVAGVAGASHMAIAASAKHERAADKASIKAAEKAVEKSPQTGALRAELGHAYLAAGRFESAVQAFTDAMTLGETSAPTVLSLALAQSAAGNDTQAAATLDQWREQLPAGDMGLALTLAGQPDRAIGLLEDAIRSGENTAKSRQNLAYSYAMAGRWREARLMAMQDVPPNMIDQRISDWAMQAQPGDFRKRVATLLSVPLRADSGQPEYLALNTSPAAPRMAEAAPAQPAGELPALAAATPAAPVSEPDSPAEAQPAATEAMAAQSGVEAAFARTVEASQPQFVAQPIVQAVAPHYAEARPQMRTAGLVTPVRQGLCNTHLVQLGSFSSEARARQAWATYTRQNPALQKFSLTITPAVVRGRHYWRVAAAGFDARGAAGMCSAVKGRGGACFAYAASRPLPGALPARNFSAPRMASR